jgi:ribonuclease Z
VTLLGTGNPRPTPERAGPASLVEAGDTKILVDAGRDAATRLFEIGQGRLLSGIDIVLLTHLHSDHVVGFPDLWLTGWIFGRAKPLALYGPPGTAAMQEGLERAYTFDVHMRRDVDEKLPAVGAEVRARDIPPGVVFENGPLRITAFAVDHGPVAPAYGYRIDCAGRSVVFSGDTRYSESLIAAAKGADVLVHEVLAPDVERRLSQMRDPALTERIIAHHTTPEDAGRVFAAASPRLAVYTHIVPSPTTAADLVPATRKTYKGRLEVGTDLMTITIGKTIDVGRAAPARPPGGAGTAPRP